LNCPLYPETEHMVNDKTLKQFKHGAYLVNTARGKLCDRDAIARTLESGQPAGYAGDVWFPQPAPQDHAASRRDPAYLGHLALGADPLCRGRPRNPRMLFRRAADP